MNIAVLSRVKCAGLINIFRDLYCSVEYLISQLFIFLTIYIGSVSFRYNFIFIALFFKILPLANVSTV